MGMSLRDMEKTYGISNAYLSQVERGKAEPGGKMLMIFMPLLKLEPKDLLLWWLKNGTVPELKCQTGHKQWLQARQKVARMENQQWIKHLEKMYSDFVGRYENNTMSFHDMATYVSHLNPDRLLELADKLKDSTDD